MDFIEKGEIMKKTNLYLNFIIKLKFHYIYLLNQIKFKLNLIIEKMFNLKNLISLCTLNIYLKFMFFTCTIKREEREDN